MILFAFRITCFSQREHKSFCCAPIIVEQTSQEDYPFACLNLNFIPHTVLTKISCCYYLGLSFEIQAVLI